MRDADDAVGRDARRVGRPYDRSDTSRVDAELRQPPRLVDLPEVALQFVYVLAEILDDGQVAIRLEVRLLVRSDIVLRSREASPLRRSSTD